MLNGTVNLFSVYFSVHISKFQVFNFIQQNFKLNHGKLLNEKVIKLQEPILKLYVKFFNACALYTLKGVHTKNGHLNVWRE